MGDAEAALVGAAREGDGDRAAAGVLDVDAFLAGVDEAVAAAGARSRR
jgi:hypothetical protein